ncbi:hypothetical protein GAY29_07335 [Azospirillum brasilense]|uniref:antA/AntB antirepressor family protein n=1 Tax=Azospirillum brasilense TaxID=192 RepID=UPI00190A7AA7|nr:antA/AntB antirepressor family protein [Azospirillum brasilense]MBK3732923.1 hypothetical protein [Azospirillum brasilense]
MTNKTFAGQDRASGSLIPLTQAVVGGQPVRAVNLRDLHAFLGVQTAFKDWIARRIADYGFEDGRDFCSFLSESQGGRPAREYHGTLDMAKELAMVERNERGKQARLYFIECERRAQVSNDLAVAVTGIVAPLVTRMESTDHQIATLSQQVQDLMLIADDRGKASRERISVRQLLDDAGAVQKGRNGINRRVGSALRALAMTQTPPIQLRRCMHSGVWLFPVEFAGRFMATVGNEWVREHNSELEGGETLTLPLLGLGRRGRKG